MLAVTGTSGAGSEKPFLSFTDFLKIISMLRPALLFCNVVILGAMVLVALLSLVFEHVFKRFGKGPDFVFGAFFRHGNQQVIVHVMVVPSKREPRRETQFYHPARNFGCISGKANRKLVEGRARFHHLHAGNGFELLLCIMGLVETQRRHVLETLFSEKTQVGVR